MIEEVPLRFGIPKPPARPGELADFSYLDVPAAGSVRRPEIDTDSVWMRDLAYDLVRVLDDQGAPVDMGPQPDGVQLHEGLRAMVMTHAYDDRMTMAQRQGKTSCYMRCTGEEAIAVGHTLELHPDDMFFPTYRQQGWLIARRWPLVEMMCQVFSNEKDRLHGRQMPIMYSARDVGFFSISGNLGTQYVQAVGWAMASAIKGDTRIASGVVGEGTTAEADFHHALTFATTYQAPVILNVVNNQWAISSFQGIAGGARSTFRDGRWATAPGVASRRQRVSRRAGGDAMGRRTGTQQPRPHAHRMGDVRAAAHSTSDDPSRYRPADEWKSWPLGDPIERLKNHLIGRGEWSEAQHDQLVADADREVLATAKEAEDYGTLLDGRVASARSIFEDVFKEMPEHLQRQRRQMEEER